MKALLRIIVRVEKPEITGTDISLARAYRAQKQIHGRSE
jgi:hypothetical protein